MRVYSGLMHCEYLILTEGPMTSVENHQGWLTIGMLTI
jgi:hypothetical protein